MNAPADYWRVRLDGAYAIRSARGIEPGYEGIETEADADAHIADLIRRDRDEAEQEAAAIDDSEASELNEAA